MFQPWFVLAHPAPLGGYGRRRKWGSRLLHTSVLPDPTMAVQEQTRIRTCEDRQPPHGLAPTRIQRRASRKEPTMNRVPRFAMTALVSGALGLAGLGLGAGIAAAAPPSGPYTWCPGDDPGGGPGGPFNSPGPPNWDWNVCHTWYSVNWGQGNVSLTIWDGPNPPPDNRGPVGPCSLLDTRGC